MTNTALSAGAQSANNTHMVFVNEEHNSQCACHEGTEKVDITAYI